MKKIEAKRIHVFVQSDQIRFPSLCSKCLGKADLSSFKSSWYTEYLREWPEKVTRTAEIEIPICRFCKKSLIEKVRKESIHKDVKALIIGTPIAWGIFYILFQLGVLQFIGDFFQTIGFSWVSWVVLLLLGGWPLIVLWMLIDDYRMPHGADVFKREVNLADGWWPVQLERHHFKETKVKGKWVDIPFVGGNTFSFENEIYAKLFEAANPGSYIKPILPK